MYSTAGFLFSPGRADIPRPFGDKGENGRGVVLGRGVMLLIKKPDTVSIGFCILDELVINLKPLF